MLRPTLLPAFLLVSVALAGCLGEGAVADLAPEARAAQAVTNFRTSMQPQGDLQKITGTLEAEGTTGELEMEFGADDVQKVSVMVGGMFQLTMYCEQGRGLLQFGEKTFESRDADCFEVDEEDDAGDPLDPLADTTLVSATVGADGALTAVFTRTEDDAVSTITAVIDAQDRITRMVVEEKETTMELELTYGERAPLDVPSTTQRLPADIDAETWFEDGHYAWTVLNAEDEVPLGELELRILDPSAEEGAAPLATFRFDGGQQESGGFTFRFVDDDGDGLVSPGDSVSVANPEWADEWTYQVVVFDTWAGLGLDENPMPFPGATALVAALAGVALALRRRA